ncbi:glycosyltransferase family 2 protein [Weissella confusa]|uniref:glycosyltransferase family 2 protein n=1 Tax=Weissella confusa TaxID=1583 RepID=UPI00223B4469|nr:glycosyltransferase family A protein [Weissella confusa]MCT0025094.1 glycosyltransferase family 2 protein [Weissella confusa]
MYFKILRRIFAVLQGKLPDPYLLALKRITATVLIRNRYAQEALESFSADRVKDAVSSEFKFQKSYDHDVSIILPVYNMEKFIGRALDSLFEIKTTYDLEILVVNDGSTDSSEAIILEKLHDAEVEDGVTFRLINQTNKGFSGARNRGIEEARGRYLFLWMRMIKLIPVQWMTYYRQPLRMTWILFKVLLLDLAETRNGR